MESMKPQLRLVDFELPEVTGRIVWDLPSDYHPGNGYISHQRGKGKVIDFILCPWKGDIV